MICPIVSAWMAILRPKHVDIHCNSIEKHRLGMVASFVVIYCHYGLFSSNINGHHLYTIYTQPHALTSAFKHLLPLFLQSMLPIVDYFFGSSNLSWTYQLTNTYFFHPRRCGRALPACKRCSVCTKAEISQIYIYIYHRYRFLYPPVN